MNVFIVVIKRGCSIKKTRKAVPWPNVTFPKKHKEIFMLTCRLELYFDFFFFSLQNWFSHAGYIVGMWPLLIWLACHFYWSSFICEVVLLKGEFWCCAKKLLTEKTTNQVQWVSMVRCRCWMWLHSGGPEVPSEGSFTGTFLSSWHWASNAAQRISIRRVSAKNSLSHYQITAVCFDWQSRAATQSCNIRAALWKSSSPWVVL